MLKIIKILSVNNRNLLLISLILLLSLTFFEILIFTSLQQILSFFSGAESIGKFGNLISFIGVNDLKYLMIFFFIVFICRSFIYVILSLTRNKLVQNINNEVSKKVYSNYLKKDFSFFLKNNSSKLISNIIIEVEKFAYRVIDPLIFFFAELFIAAGVFLYLVVNFPEGTIFMTLLIFFSYLFFYKTYVIFFQNLGETKTIADAKKIDDLQKSFYIINEIKIGKLEKYFTEVFSGNTKISSKSQFLLSFFSDMPKAIIEIIALLFISGLLYYSYFILDYSNKDILLMSGIFAVALFRFLPSVNRIYHSINSIKYHLSSIDIIYAEIFKNYEEKNNNLTTTNLIHKNLEFKTLEIKNLFFSYDNKNNVLENINLTIKRGQMIGIYGDSGCGKSTLLNLICGLLDPVKGKILYNDNSILNFKSSYYDLIGYVSQNIFLTDDSLKKNIVLGDTIFKNDKFFNALTLSNLNETVNLMKQKENTNLGERGASISGGQKQRVGIARALYKESEILILDEPTSALDSKSANEILKTILSLKGNTTILIVSHNMDIIKKCDESYKIENKIILKNK